MSFTKDKTKVTDLQKKEQNQKTSEYHIQQYQTIDDLPMWNFRKVISTADTRYLFILNNYINLPNKFVSAEKWESIFWDYIDKKGIDYNFKLRLELKARIAILENEEIFEGKKNYTKIELTKLRLKDLDKKVKKNVDTENDAILSKFMGFPINPKQHTVLQYIGFENLLIEANKKHGSDNR